MQIAYSKSWEARIDNVLTTAWTEIFFTHSDPNHINVREPVWFYFSVFIEESTLADDSLCSKGMNTAVFAQERANVVLLIYF